MASTDRDPRTDAGPGAAGRALERAAAAKQYEIGAHRRAITMHEMAAAHFDRVGNREAAADARVRAEHARQRLALALAEQLAQTEPP